MDLFIKAYCSIWFHYGPQDNWTTGTWSYGGSSLTDPTLKGNNAYRILFDYAVRVQAQVSSGNNVTGGPASLCNIRMITNRMTVQGYIGTYPCPYNDVTTYDVVMPNGIAYVAGLHGSYGIYQLSFVEQCTTDTSEWLYLNL